MSAIQLVRSIREGNGYHPNLTNLVGPVLEVKDLQGGVLFNSPHKQGGLMALRFETSNNLEVVVECDQIFKQRTSLSDSDLDSIWEHSRESGDGDWLLAEWKKIK